MSITLIWEYSIYVYFSQMIGGSTNCFRAVLIQEPEVFSHTEGGRGTNKVPSFKEGGGGRKTFYPVLWAQKQIAKPFRSAIFQL